MSSATATTNGTITTYVGTFGGGAANTYFAGNINLVKVYSRGLTATEVQQNFNAIRGRYGI
jgi:hypothetical protein